MQIEVSEDELQEIVDALYHARGFMEMLTNNMSYGEAHKMYARRAVTYTRLKNKLRAAQLGRLEEVGK